jgi:PAS domain S-box-containing protein
MAEEVLRTRAAIGWLPLGEHVLGLIVLGVAYLLLAKFGLALASLHPSASPIWPPSGLALAAVLLWGNRVWPAIAVGAYLANVTTFGTILSSLAIAAGNTLEALVTAWLIEKWSSRSEPFQTPSRVATFAVLALAPGTMISATVGVASLAQAGYFDAGSFVNIWLTWWLGDASGQLLVAPVLVLWAKCNSNALQRRELQRTGALLFLTAGVGLLAFSPVLDQTSMRGSLAFLAIVPLLWAALRHNQRDTATAALVLSIFAVWGTLANGGPFARPSLNESFSLVIMFIVSAAVPALVLSADVAVRKTSEESYRSLIDNANDIVATLDLNFRFSSVNPAVERILGYTPQEIIGTPLSHYVPQDQLAMHQEMLTRKLKGEIATQYEMQLQGKNCQRFTLEVNSKLIFDGGIPIAIQSIARDITQRKNAEAGQAVLIRELQHRTKNMLAVIQSIATHTLRRSQDLEHARGALVGRLHALAHAQEFVVSGPGGGAPLRELVEAELSVFGARAIISGDDLTVGGSFAQTFALVVHELATNSVKYGSLSAERGHVVLAWKIDRSSERPQLTFSWKERGGPPATSPDVTGLGTQLISMVGETEIAFKDEGFEYWLAVSLEEVVRGIE